MGKPCRAARSRRATSRAGLRRAEAAYYGGRYYGYYGHPYYYPSHVVYGRPYYAYPYGYQPYYAFHPHFSIGFGFFVGYPVAYPGWYNPYAVSTFGFGVSYGASYGGISFDMQPYDAAVFIDGRYVGAAYDFGPQAAPLTLRSGPHHVELHAEGLAPLGVRHHRGAGSGDSVSRDDAGGEVVEQTADSLAPDTGSLADARCRCCHVRAYS